MAAGNGDWGGGYDPAEFARDGVRQFTTGLEKGEDDELDSLDGSMLNTRHATMGLELILKNGERHTVLYGSIQPLPYLSPDADIIRFLFPGYRWVGKRWTEDLYTVTITGKRLASIYVKIAAGTRARIRLTGPISDTARPQVDDIVIGHEDVEEVIH